MDGLEKAINIFRKATTGTIAYEKFLAKNKVNPNRIKNWKDFQSLPLTSKEKYLRAYKFPDFFLKNKVPPMAYASSGSSGQPMFWFRDDEKEKLGADLHEKIFANTFAVKKGDPTLVIICFSMGVWIAGNYTLACCRELARRGYNLSCITPGTEKEDIFSVLKELAPQFKNIVLAGYPPFVMDVLTEAARRKIDLDKNIKILTAGDKFTEDWRDSALKIIKSRDIYGGVASVYGSADAGMMGYETPLSVFLRREAVKNKKLYKELFGDSSILPALVQYDPHDIFFEEVGDELVLTAEGPIPLVRYNIHDTGRILPHQEIKNLIKKHSLAHTNLASWLEDWQLPFLVIKGRSDVAVTFYALNIYPEHIKKCLEDKRISKFLSGNYVAYNRAEKKGKVQKLFFDLEQAPKFKISSGVLKLISEVLVEDLKKINSEFRKLYSVIGPKADPVIKIIPRIISGKGLVQTGGKKPRFLL